MVRPAILDDLDRFIAERRGELRRLDLLAHGIDLDLDPAQLVDLGRAPDHEDILAELKIPDKYLEPIWREWFYARVLPNGYPAAIASRGQVDGQAIIDHARREADQVRRLLVEVARLKVEGQVPDLDQLLAAYEPGSLDWHLALDDYIDQVLDPAQGEDPSQVQDLDPNPAPGTAPEESVRTAPEDFGFGKADSTSAGQGHSQRRTRSGEQNQTFVAF